MLKAMIRIRRYEKADEAAVVKLHNIALAATGAHLGPGPWDADLQAIDDVYLCSGGEFLVGVLDGEVIAMGALRRVDDQLAEIKRMRTEPSHQRRGFGRHMLARLEQRAVQLGCQRLRLDTTENQFAARGLYESAGYREIRREPSLGADENLIYEKPIARDHLRRL